MQQRLTEQEQQHLDRRVAEAEQRTGAQIVLAVVERSDVCAELPWKAFALGASAAGLTVVLLDLLRSYWPAHASVLLAVAAMLAAGAFFSLGCVLVPGAARFFLDRNRAETEVRQYAESLFLSRRLFATRGRTGILLLVSLFERQVVVLPDTGLHERLEDGMLRSIIGRMTAVLAAGQVAGALEEGLIALEHALSATAPAAGGENELPDEVVQEGGA